MDEQAVLALLEEHRNDRGIAHFERLYPDTPYRSVGVGLTQLRKLAKQVGRDASLAATLWESEVYEARVLSLLIDDPRTLTPEQAEQQVERLDVGMLAHVFSSCDATLAKTPFVVELAERWMTHDDPMRRRCGFCLLYEVSKSKKKSAPDEAWFQRWIDHIDSHWRSEDTDGRMAMATALMGVGKRTWALNRAALEVAKAIGPIDFDPTGQCEPMDVTKHIDTERLRAKLGG